MKGWIILSDKHIRLSAISLISEVEEEFSVTWEGSDFVAGFYLLLINSDKRVSYVHKDIDVVRRVRKELLLALANEANQRESPTYEPHYRSFW